MSWSYSGDPSQSELDWCRFALADTDSTEPIMQDEEIQYLIDTFGANRDALLYELFSKAAVIFAREIKMSLGPQSEDPTERLAFFRSQAKQYKQKLSVASGLSIPRYASEKVFRIDMHSNPPSGSDA